MPSSTMETTKPLGQIIGEMKYQLTPDELKFYQTETGIMDEEALKEHITQVQKEAFTIYPYPCIESFRFLNTKMPRMSAYLDVLKLGRERKGAILLDIGCCFGNEARKAVSDGFPVNQVIASDLQPGFWDLGHKLFKSTPESCTITFVAGDVFKLIKPQGVAETRAEAITYPDIKTLSLTDLNPLVHKISAIFAGSFFHLFSEEKQLEVAKSLGSLLSPETGSIIFGGHVGADTKRMRTDDFKREMFCHSPETWNEMWDRVFEKGTVNCKSFLHPQFPFIIWSVTRV